jgi:hypothetical protein
MKAFVIVSTGVAIIIGVVITVLLFIFRLFVLGGMGLGILCILILLLGRLTSEEGVLFVLKRHGGSCEYINGKISFSKKAIARLKKRGIVTIEDGIVRLVNPDYPCIFDEPDD